MSKREEKDDRWPLTSSLSAAESSGKQRCWTVTLPGPRETKVADLFVSRSWRQRIGLLSSDTILILFFQTIRPSGITRGKERQSLLLTGLVFAVVIDRRRCFQTDDTWLELVSRWPVKQQPCQHPALGYSNWRLRWSIRVDWAKLCVQLPPLDTSLSPPASAPPPGETGWAGVWVGRELAVGGSVLKEKDG